MSSLQGKSPPDNHRVCQGDMMDAINKISRKVKPSAREVADISRVLGRLICSINSTQDNQEDIDRDNTLKDTLRTLSKLVGTVDTLESPQPAPAVEDEPVQAVERFGYNFHVFPRQRLFSSIENRLDILASGSGCHMVIRNLPRDFLEPQLLPLLDQCGRIHELRIPTDFETGLTKGQAYVTFYEPSQVARAITKFHGFEYAPGSRLIIRQITPKTRLFIGNLPKCKQHVDLEKSFSVLTHGLCHVISFPAERRGQNNRGFCFLDYHNHESAVAARKRLTSMKIFGCDLQVDWAWEKPIPHRFPS